MKEKIFQKSPLFFQNILISIFNILAYRKRYGGSYRSFLSYYKLNKSLSLFELEKIQEKKFTSLVKYSIKHSRFYRNLYKDFGGNITLSSIDKLPIVSKDDLQNNLLDIYTVSKRVGLKSKTGGTTGKSLEVLFTKKDMQERFAQLDAFRGQYGYSLGERTAWFSGKLIVFEKDVKHKRFWKTDYFYNIRYYSTFHIKKDYLSNYIDDLISFKPKFINGFPSVMMEIAQYGLANNYSFPSGVVKAIFPTAEAVTPRMRKVLERFFNSKVYDQYASSEGAPFIFECKNQKLHLQMQTGVFEVLDSNYEPTNEGKLIVTSFTTHGTPLIRYEIGDTVSLSDSTCNCGDNNPIIEKILGRNSDFIYSTQHGRINSANIANTLKNTFGIIKFQVVQNELDSILIKIITNDSVYKLRSEKIFLKNWRDRVGEDMKITLEKVETIPLEKSGKYRMVKNNIIPQPN